MDKAIEQAFETTTKVVLGKALSGKLEDYESWLLAHQRPAKKHQSAVSEQMVYDPPLVFYAPVSKRAVKQAEALEIGKCSLAKEEALRLTLDNAAQMLEPMRHHTSDAITGENVEVEECSLYINCSYSFRCCSFVNSKYCAYSFWPRDSEYLFGVDTVFSSKFCLKCYNSVNLTRCLEVSHSSNCSDCYFCHNCDSLADCMFCTNAKSLRYAIFNHEVGKEKYLEIKKRVLEEMTKKLERDKHLELSIFNIAEGRSKR